MKGKGKGQLAIIKARKVDKNNPLTETGSLTIRLKSVLPKKILYKINSAMKTLHNKIKIQKK